MFAIKLMYLKNKNKITLNNTVRKKYSLFLLQILLQFSKIYLGLHLDVYSANKFQNFQQILL
jgi:hypothetical protein